MTLSKFLFDPRCLICEAETRTTSQSHSEDERARESTGRAKKPALLSGVWSEQPFPSAKSVLLTGHSGRGSEGEGPPTPGPEVAA